MINAVIFDMDGTLADTEKYLVAYWVKAAVESGFSVKKEDILPIRSLAAEYARPYLKERFGEAFEYDEVRKRRIQLMEEAHVPLEAKAGAREILEELNKRNIRTAVATASSEEKAREVLSALGLYDMFSCIICAPDMEHGKPMPDVYLHACKVLGEKPENCMAVEDSPNGVLSASRAGLRTVMVPDLTPPEEEILPCLYGVADDLMGILRFLD